MQIELSIDTSFTKETEYIRSSLASEAGIMGSRAFFCVEKEAEAEYIPIVEEIILTSFKYAYFYKELQNKVAEAVDYAILFAIIDFDSYRERQKVDAACNGREICIDGIYNFAMQELREEWDKLVELLKEFYSNEPGYSDKSELLAYMLQGFKSCYKRARYFVSDVKDVQDIQKVVYYHDKIDVSECSDEVRKLFSVIYR